MWKKVCKSIQECSLGQFMKHIVLNQIIFMFSINVDSTQCPQFLLDAIPTANIVVTQRKLHTRKGKS